GLGVGRPPRERGPVLHGVRPELLLEVPVGSLVEQIEVVGAQQAGVVPNPPVGVSGRSSHAQIPRLSRSISCNVPNTSGSSRNSSKARAARRTQFGRSAPVPGM